MLRKMLVIGAAISMSGFFGCGDPVSGENRTTIFSDGFEADLSKWEEYYMINVGDNNPHMRITNEVTHNGTNSVTTDSNRTALLYKLDGNDKINTGICGVEFYIMTKAAGQINFTVELGQNAGSSGGLGRAFGIGFDVQDSVKTTYKGNEGRQEKMIGPIQLNHWYQCKIEINFAENTITYYIDNVKVNQLPIPTVEMYGIDRLLVYRGPFGGSNDYPIACSEGVKQYYVDDIVFYKK